MATHGYGNPGADADAPVTVDEGVALGLAQKQRDIQYSAQNGQQLRTENVPRYEEDILQQPPSALQQKMANLNPMPLVQEKAAIITNELAVDSHDLAHSNEIGGAVRTYGAGVGEVRDLGWHKSSAEIPDPLIGGLSNGKLFAMIRRFNKDVFAVESVPPHVARGLDLNEAWSDEYANDKILLHLQRFYIGIFLGLASLFKQVARLRSWKETNRTAAFCVAYFAAWLLDLLIPLTLGTLITIISSKAARDTLFPPAPRALVDAGTGELQKPAAGQLGTMNSLTGAPEKQEGQAVEEEAANFVDNLRHLAQKAVGMHTSPNNKGDPLEGKVPKPVRKGIKAVQAAGSAEGHTTESHDQTQEPMEKIIWDKINPELVADIIKTAPHVVGEIVDNWERFANAICPTAPFSPYSFLRLDAVLVPLFLGSLLINSYMVYKGTGFAIGFVIFGDPVLTPAMQWIKRNYPNYTELIEPKNNILRGVPTNTQLTITLLRIGEAHNTPLPPVPSTSPDDADQEHPIDFEEDIPLDNTQMEKEMAIKPTASVDNPPPEEKPDAKHKAMSRITRIFKGQGKAAVETKLAIDHVRAKAGSDKAKGHLGVLPKTKYLIYAGPSHFKARYDGKPGWLYITEGPRPRLLYTTKDPRPTANGEPVADLQPLVDIDIEGIKKLKRATAFVSKVGEKVADFSTGKELLGSLELDDKFDKTWRFTAVPERDELFNRLVAVGSQAWTNL